MSCGVVEGEVEGVEGVNRGWGDIRRSGRMKSESNSGW